MERKRIISNCGEGSDYSWNRREAYHKLPRLFAFSNWKRAPIARRFNE